VMKYVGKMKSESSFDPPPPPEKDFDYCFACDSARQRAYQIASDEFIKDFLKEETEMLEKAFPGYESPVMAFEMGKYIADFALTGHRFFNGKVLPVAVTTP